MQIAAGVGLLKLREWGRLLQIGTACLGLLGIPCGTLISIFILVYMLKPGVKVLFSGKTTFELTPEEASAAAKVLQGSGAPVLIVVAVAFIGVAGIGVIAAIAIPSLLRARISANEAAALAHLRSLGSAEAAYARANGGFVDKPECLREPARCLPKAPVTAPFLDAAVLFDAPSMGYVLRFHPGPAAPVAREGAALSASSLQSFAASAVPVKPNQTGVRAFCTDASGRVCTLRSGAEEIDSGRCPPSCEDF